jgi:hypothetical protein
MHGVDQHDIGGALGEVGAGVGLDGRHALGDRGDLGHAAGALETVEQQGGDDGVALDEGDGRAPRREDESVAAQARRGVDHAGAVTAARARGAGQGLIALRALAGAMTGAAGDEFGVDGAGRVPAGDLQLQALVGVDEHELARVSGRLGGERHTQALGELGRIPASPRCRAHDQARPPVRLSAGRG